MSEEYQALRQEILEWQTRRFTIVSGAIVVVTAVLGWITQNPDEWPWAIASTVLLAPLACACYLTWLFGSVNTRLGTYLGSFTNRPKGEAAGRSEIESFGPAGRYSTSTPLSHSSISSLAVSQSASR